MSRIDINVLSVYLIIFSGGKGGSDNGSDNGGGEERGTDSPWPDNSSSTIKLLLGISIPFLVVLIATVTVVLVCIHSSKKKAANSATFNNVKTLSFHSQSRPESLIYHNQVGGAGPGTPGTGAGTMSPQPRRIEHQPSQRR